VRGIAAGHPPLGSEHAGTGVSRCSAIPRANSPQTRVVMLTAHHDGVAIGKLTDLGVGGHIFVESVRLLSLLPIHCATVLHTRRLGQRHFPALWPQELQ
jgi:hypothetical protein